MNLVDPSLLGVVFILIAGVTLYVANKRLVR